MLNQQHQQTKISFDEFDRQQHAIQALKRLEYLSKSFTSFDFEEIRAVDNNNKPSSSYRTRSSKSKTKENIEQEKESQFFDDENDESYESFNEAHEDYENVNTKPIDIINNKISKLDTLFSGLTLVKQVGDPSYYEIEHDFKTKEAMALAKEKEEKSLNLFSSIYSMKTVIYDLKTHLHTPIENKAGNQDEYKPSNEEKSKVPKLVELYQYRFTDYGTISLPHGIDLDLMLKKVLNSIFYLYKQDTFWWCFLSKYQNLPSVQQEYFYKISENYVKLIFTDMEMRYREKFFNIYPDLVAMSVYTIFCNCFPQSVMSQFNDEFKDFLCQICHLWMTGCKPMPHSFLIWNFKKLDPPEAVFAKEVLNNKDNNIINDILGALGNSKLNQTSLSSIQGPSLNSTQGYSYRSSKVTMASNKNPHSASSRRRVALIPSDILKIAQDHKNSQTTKFFQNIHKKESHPACRGPEFDDVLFDICGNSPLVDYYLYTKNARKINKTETLVRRSNVIKLPPLDSKTYDDIIKESVKNIKSIEKNYKETKKRSENEYLKILKQNADTIREHKENCKTILSKPTEVSLIGNLIAMNNLRDSNSTGYQVAIDAAIKRSLKSSMSVQAVEGMSSNGVAAQHRSSRTTASQSTLAMTSNISNYASS